MFTDAITTVSQFTRPLLLISRTYRSKAVIPGLATLFFINDQGCAITCRHVAEQFIQAEKINEDYRKFLGEVAVVREHHPNTFKKEHQKLEKKYGYHNGITVNAKCQFIDVPTPPGNITVHIHPKYDLAIMQFSGFDRLNYQADHIFLLGDDSEVRQGKSLCRLGYPFPEYSNFQYNPNTDDIEWTSNNSHVPSFPLDGMVTRHLGDAQTKNVYGIELSTPGLRGQSGGPLFDHLGRIFGMQFATHHLYLGFDMDRVPMDVNGETKYVTNQPFLHVGRCIHIRIIKDFLDQYHIPYKTA